MNSKQGSELERFISQLQMGSIAIDLEEARHYAIHYIRNEYSEYIDLEIHTGSLDEPIKIKSHLRAMGCDGGFDPVPPQQIEIDACLTPLERFTALIRAAIQFYAYAGPAQQLRGHNNSMIRWGFLHIDEEDNPDTRFFGLHQDMVRYITDQACTELKIGIPGWVQRGNSSHIRQLADNLLIGEALLLDAYFGSSFEGLVAAINGSAGRNLFAELAELSDEIDNCRLLEFPSEIIEDYEQQYTKIVQSISGST